MKNSRTGERVNRNNHYVKLEMGLAAEEKAGKEKDCPRCGKQKEEFAVVWGWKHCYTCSVELQGSEVK